MTDVTIAEVADELYGLAPGEFIAVRDERARETRAAGDRDLAGAIKKLARPTASAWLVNQLARQAGPQLSRLYEVGEALAEAQRTLAGERLRELSADRRQVIGELLPVAGELAERLGQPASAAVLGEVRSTLEAALADAAARSAVQSGRLTKALAYAGLGEVDISAAVALPVPVPVPLPAEAGAGGRGRQRSGSARDRASPGRDSAGAGASRPGGPSSTRTAGGRDPAHAAADALAAAQADADEAAAALTAAEQQVTSLTEQRQFLARRIAHLERELTQVHDEDAQLAREARQASRARDVAVKSADAASRRLARARDKAAETS